MNRILSSNPASHSINAPVQLQQAADTQKMSEKSLK
jgi:hypothetical protein